MNRWVVLANKYIGSSYTSLQTFFALLNPPLPASQHAYRQHMNLVAIAACTEVEESMHAQGLCRNMGYVQCLNRSSSRILLVVTLLDKNVDLHHSLEPYRMKWGRFLIFKVL